MARILVLGAGMVGSAIARDLARVHRVRAADRSEKSLHTLTGGDIDTLVLDVSDADAVAEAASNCDLVVGAVPGFLGYRTLEAVITTGKPAVDISFFPEDPLQLHDLARSTGSIVVVDAGVAPGLDNLILGHHDRTMKIERFECLVGGLPKVRTWPFEYKAPFSPIDVIEEYTRPARYVEAGNVVTRPALSDPEIVEFARVGSLESFNTDGLRTLIETMSHIPYMKEKTLRYPGHIEIIRALQESGFFSDESIRVNGVEVSPLAFTSRLLTDNWRLQPGEAEFTVMRVTIEGESGGKPKQFVYDLYDEFDATTKTSSMARTTGYTCSAIVELILNGHYGRVGVSPPEIVGREVGCFGRVVGYLAERGVTLHTSQS